MWVARPTVPTLRAMALPAAIPVVIVPVIVIGTAAVEPARPKPNAALATTEPVPDRPPVMRRAGLAQVTNTNRITIPPPPPARHGPRAPPGKVWPLRPRHRTIPSAKIARRAPLTPIKTTTPSSVWV